MTARRLYARAQRAGDPGESPSPTSTVLRRAEAKTSRGWARRFVYVKDATLHLVERELTSRYRRSLLGWLWSLAPPLLQLAIFHFVFTRVIPLDVDHFALFLLTGILTWNWLSTALSLATTSLESRRDLVLRPGFPTVLIPLVSVFVALVDYLVALPVLLIAVGVTVGLDGTVALLPALLAVQLLLVAGLAWLLAPLNVFFRDVNYLVSLALMFGFWLTPVFYSPEQVPERFSSAYEINPMTHLIDGHRSILLDGVAPALGPLALVAVASLGIFAAGFAVFAACRHALPEQL